METIKISSVMDVITNSSTEVFTIFDEEALDNVKNTVDVLLALGNCEYKFDDLFDIEFSFDYDCILDSVESWLDSEGRSEEAVNVRDMVYNERYDYVSTEMSYEDVLKIAKEHDEYAESYRAIEGYSIRPKAGVEEKIGKDKLCKAIEVIENFDNMFTRDASYC